MRSLALADESSLLLLLILPKLILLSPAPELETSLVDTDNEVVVVVVVVVEGNDDVSHDSRLFSLVEDGDFAPNTEVREDNDNLPLNRKLLLPFFNEDSS